MEYNIDFAALTLWSFYGTIAFLLLAIFGFILKWGFRFRFVGATGFMAVLTVGLFGLNLALFSRVVIPNALRYNLVYDTGGDQTVITVPANITSTQLEATLQQASFDLFSPGRGSNDGDSKLTIRARTQLHEEGVTYPLYVGQIRRSLFDRDDANPEIKIFKDKMSRLKSFANG